MICVLYISAVAVHVAWGRLSVRSPFSRLCRTRLCALLGACLPCLLCCAAKFVSAVGLFVGWMTWSLVLVWPFWRWGKRGSALLACYPIYVLYCTVDRRWKVKGYTI
jgi:hypothetical protein